MQSKHFVEIMDNPSSSSSEKLNAMKEAISAHSQRTRSVTIISMFNLLVFYSQLIRLSSALSEYSDLWIFFMVFDVFGVVFIMIVLY